MRKEFGTEPNHFINGIKKEQNLCNINYKRRSLNKIKAAIQGYQNVDHVKTKSYLQNFTTLDEKNILKNFKESRRTAQTNNPLEYVKLLRKEFTKNFVQQFSKLHICGGP